MAQTIWLLLLVSVSPLSAVLCTSTSTIRGAWRLAGASWRPSHEKPDLDLLPRLALAWTLALACGKCVWL